MMSGGQLRIATLGTTSEHLAEAFFSAFAFTIRVRRENDLGHDLHCVLHEPVDDAETARRESGVVSAGSPFNVQVKSNRKKIRFEELHARRWIGRQHSPFFVCIVDRSRQEFNLHSTWNLHNGIQMYGYGEVGDPESVDSIELVLPALTEERKGLPAIIDPDKNSHCLAIPLGPAILTKTLADVMDPTGARAVATVLKDWIDFERANIVREAMRMHWVYGPNIWQEGERISEQTEMTAEFYVNGNNLYRHPKDQHSPTVSENLVRSAIALQLTIAKHRRERRERPNELPGITPGLERALANVIANADDIIRGDPVMRNVIERRRPTRQGAPPQDPS